MEESIWITMPQFNTIHQQKTPNYYLSFINFMLLIIVISYIIFFFLNCLLPSNKKAILKISFYTLFSKLKV